jgi:hypothetical protein
MQPTDIFNYLRSITHLTASNTIYYCHLLLHFHEPNINGILITYCINYIYIIGIRSALLLVRLLFAVMERLMKQLTIKILLGFALAMVGVQAQATPISLTPSTGACGTAPCLFASGTDPVNPDADYISGLIGVGDVTELYKSDNPGESGAFKDSYKTTFANTETDPADATVEYNGDGGGTSAIDCSDECYFLVKDGNQDPIWYLFDISGWDGEMDIVATDFWPGSGAISHVSIFGSISVGTEPPGGVPGPAPLVLMGIGLLGVSLRRLVKAS